MPKFAGRGVWMIAAVGLLSACSSSSTTDEFPRSSSGCESTVPTTSSPMQTVNTVQPGTLPLQFAMQAHPSVVCPGGTVVVAIKIDNSGDLPITGFQQPIIMGCGSPPELVVGAVGPVDIPPRGSATTSATFTVPSFGPHDCGFSVYGYARSADLVVAAPTPSPTT